MSDFDGVLFLPGLMCDERLFAPQIRALEPEFRVEVADISGHSSFEDMAHSALEQTKFERFALAGLSMGGSLAMNMARWFSQRVARLAILDASPYEDDEARRANRYRQMACAREEGLEVLNREELAQKCLAPQNQTPELIDALVSMAERHGVEVHERQQAALMARQPIIDYLAAYENPTLVLCGEHDELCLPQWHQTMADVLPDAHLVMVPDAGHMTTLEQPEAVNKALLDWLHR